MTFMFVRYENDPKDTKFDGRIINDSENKDVKFTKKMKINRTKVYSTSLPPLSSVANHTKKRPNGHPKNIPVK